MNIFSVGLLSSYNIHWQKQIGKLDQKRYKIHGVNKQNSPTLNHCEIKFCVVCFQTEIVFFSFGSHSHILIWLESFIFLQGLLNNLCLFNWVRGCYISWLHRASKSNHLIKNTQKHFYAKFWDQIINQTLSWELSQCQRLNLNWWSVRNIFHYKIRGKIYFWSTF